MKKGVSSGIETIAKIILIVLVLFIIISALNGLYGQTFKDGIKKLFGEKTEAEVTHEQNEMVKEAFETSLYEDLKKRGYRRINIDGTFWSPDDMADRLNKEKEIKWPDEIKTCRHQSINSSQLCQICKESNEMLDACKEAWNRSVKK